MTLQLTNNTIKSKNKVKVKKGNNNNKNTFDSISSKQIIINNSVLEKLKYLHFTHGYTVQASYSEIIERLLQCVDTEKFSSLNSIIDSEDD